MAGLLSLSRSIDGLNRWLGVAASWCVLLAALVCALDAGLRYGINGILYLANAMGSAGDSLQFLFDVYRTNSNTLRDLQLVLFAAMVMLGASWTLKVNEHVRVDLVYTSVSDRTRIWIDFFGCLLFLLPFCILMIYFSWGWFMESWTGNELSQNAGGMPRWPAKFFIPFGFGLLLLQGVSELIKCWAALTGDDRREHGYEKHVQ